MPDVFMVIASNYLSHFLSFSLAAFKRIFLNPNKSLCLDLPEAITGTGQILTFPHRNIKKGFCLLIINCTQLISILLGNHRSLPRTRGYCKSLSSSLVRVLEILERKSSEKRQCIYQLRNLLNELASWLSST